MMTSLWSYIEKGEIILLKYSTFFHPQKFYPKKMKQNVLFKFEFFTSFYSSEIFCKVSSLLLFEGGDKLVDITVSSMEQISSSFSSAFNFLFGSPFLTVHKICGSNTLVSIIKSNEPVEDLLSFRQIGTTLLNLLALLSYSREVCRLLTLSTSF